MVWKNTWTIYIICFVSILGLGFIGGWTLRGYFSGRTVDGIRGELGIITGELDKSAKYISELERFNSENADIIANAEERLAEISTNNNELQFAYDELVSTNTDITRELDRVQELHREDTIIIQRNTELISRSRELVRQLKEYYTGESNIK